MKKLLILVFSTSIIAGSSIAQKKIMVSASQPEAEIYSNGQKVGVGTAQVVVRKNTKTVVHARRIGFLPVEQIFYNSKNMSKPPKTYYMDMIVDDSYVASDVIDNANIDFSIGFSGIDETTVWKIATSIVTTYFDVVEVSDKETMYLRTAWQVQTFKGNTVRTRIILKSGGTNTLKIKLVSEHSEKAGTSVKSDEEFKEWDRVLRKYTNVIPEFQTRLAEKNRGN